MDTIDIDLEEERAVARIVDDWAREFREDYRDEFGGAEELEAVVAENLSDWRSYARDQWRKEQQERRKPRLATVDEGSPNQRLTLPRGGQDPPIDIYEKNVLVFGGKEGVAAARRIAARAEAVRDEQAQQIKAFKSRISKLERDLASAQWVLRGAAVAHVKRRLMPVDAAKTLACAAGGDRYFADLETVNRTAGWLEAILAEK